MKSFRYLLLLTAAISLPAHAYELATHGRLTHEAYKRSVLKSDSELLKGLGIKDITTFGTSYYDISGDQVVQREKNDFEQSAKRMPEEVDPISLPGWLLRGAIREDDYPFGPNPMDDPVNAVRPFNHFYDPVLNRALTTILGITPGEKAPDWGLGVRDVFSNPNDENIFRDNHFTVFDAREAMYRALTGKSKDNQEVAATKDDRNKYWATLFRALGDIVHLVEDMAQPQHTRNDPHAGKKFDSNFAPLGHKSVYEAYVEARATGGTLEVPGVFSIAANGLTYDGYTTPRFTDYLSYFTTRQVDRKEHA